MTIYQDRSLGSVELPISALAKKSGDPQYRYESTGAKEMKDPIHLDQGNALKGTLHYTATFIPALAVKGIEFEGKRSEIVPGSVDVSDDDLSTYDEVPGIPSGVTIKLAPKVSPLKLHVASKSTDSGQSGQSSQASDIARTSGTGASTPNEGVEMSTDELLTHQSGIIVFNVKSGSLTRRARLEVLLDDGYWPCLGTFRARSTKAVWEYVGEGFIREIDFSLVWLRLNEAGEGEKDDIIAEWKGGAKQFLKSTMSGSHAFILRHGDNDDERTSTVVIEARYVPVPVELEPSETVNSTSLSLISETKFDCILQDQGVVRVQLLRGHEIQGVDRGGTSDPFAVFTLNGERVFKSETQKKTLNPDWNEEFSIPVPSRFKADFSVEIFDWNQIEAAKSLGSAKIDIADMEAFEPTERTLNLLSPRHGEKGQVVIRMTFTPEIIARERKHTSTFTSAGRAMTQFGGLPVAAGKGVLHGVAGVFKKEHHDRETIPDVPSGQASRPAWLPDTLQARNTAALPNTSMDGSAQEPGTLQVTVVNAKDLSSDSRPYATIRVGDKEVKTKHTGKTSNPEWGETFEFPAGALTPKLFAWIHDHKTLGRDKELGDGEVDIWRHIQPTGMSSADVFLELRQGGQLRLRLQFDANANPLARSITNSSGERVPRIPSMSSPSRFSLSRNRRPVSDDD